MKVAVDCAPLEFRVALIKAHPALANKTQRAAGLTAESNAEQDSVGLDRLSKRRIRGIRARQQCLPRRVWFPLHRLCSSPQEGSHSARFRAPVAERRQDGNAEVDRGNLPDRGASRWSACGVDDRLQVHGRLSTHVLDTHSGRPAAGIAVELVELSDLGASRVVARATTNGDGHRSAVDSRSTGADLSLRIDFQRRELFCGTATGNVRSAVSRPNSTAVFGERARMPSPCAASGHALELRDLSGELIIIHAAPTQPPLPRRPLPQRCCRPR
jgi:5-hydroxyisourate hydrolase-like protein (transthyretin family)